MTGKILMADGTYIEGKAFGYNGTTLGELVFNTGMTGYQEILTDPSYAGQIVTMTYPLMGNYGINMTDFESGDCKVQGFVVKDYANHPSHWQLDKSLEDYLIENKIIGLYDVDTRMITKRIRNHGAMNAVLTTQDLTVEEMQEMLDGYVFPADIVAKVSVKNITSYEEMMGESVPGTDNNPLVPGTNNNSKVKGTIGLIDLGVKKGIVKNMAQTGYDIKIYPYNVRKDQLDKDHKAIIFSNGPGDPKQCTMAIELAKELKGQVPLFGICLGHQILSLSLGADTYKLKFGHRGSNHPVIDLHTGKVYMTSQNHGYAVDGSSLPEGLELTHMNVNDDTVEGIRTKDGLVRCVQFHPEEGPGPTDATVIFKQWLDTLEGGL